MVWCGRRAVSDALTTFCPLFLSSFLRVVSSLDVRFGAVGDLGRLSPASNTNYSVDLSDHGNSKPGTLVELWGRWEGQNQVWKLQKVQ